MLSYLCTCILCLVSVVAIEFSSVTTKSESCSHAVAYIGSYTSEISWYGVSNSGQFSYMDTFSDPAILNPSWLTLSSSKEYMYAVSEVKDYEGYSGAVVALSRDPVNHELSLINKVSTGGASPCHLALSPDDSYLYVSNYCSGNLAIIELLADGSLGNMTQLVNHSDSVTSDCDEAHVHEVVLDENRVLVNDLGLDSVFQYDWDPISSQLKAPLLLPPTVKVAPGAGPRHLMFHPHLNYAFLVSELDSTVTSLSYSKHSTKALSVLSTVSSLLPDASNVDMGAAEIQISNDGAFVYVSNRDISEDPNLNRSSVSVFSVNPASGALTLIQCQSSFGEHPRHFTLFDNEEKHVQGSDVHYLLVANQNSDNIVTFIRDTSTGMLSAGSPFYSPHLNRPTQVLIVGV